MHPRAIQIAPSNHIFLAHRLTEGAIDLQMLPGHPVQQNLQQRQPQQQQTGRPPTWLGAEPLSAWGPAAMQQGAVPGRRVPRTGSLLDISGV